MAKLMVMTMFMVGLMAMLNLTGIVPNSMWTIDNSSFFESSLFYLALAAAVGGLVAVGAISIGLIGGSSNLVVSVAAIAAGAFGGTFIGYMIQVVNIAKASGNTWVSYIIYLIFLIIEIGYAFSVFDWARGND